MKVSSVFGKKAYRAILQKVTGMSTEALFLAPETTLSEEEAASFRELSEKYDAGTPLAYVLGEHAFYGRSFVVNEHVLIPRPETEGLLERALGFEAKRVLELCTGSGILAVSLALEGRSVTASDISKEALDVARINASHHEAVIEFVQSDLFTHVEGKYDMILANPPYIDSEVLKGLDVYHQEPTLALDGGKEGMELINRILEEAPNYLHDDGILLMEIGWDQAEAVKKKATHFSCVTIERDLFGRDRYVIARAGRKYAGKIR